MARFSPGHLTVTRLGVATISALLLLCVSGCASVGRAAVPTCGEYAAMASNTGLFSDLSEEQRTALKNILVKHNRETTEQNLMIASVQVTAYCNIFDGAAGSNSDDPIDGIPGLQE